MALATSFRYAPVICRLTDSQTTLDIEQGACHDLLVKTNELNHSTGTKLHYMGIQLPHPAKSNRTY